VGLLLWARRASDIDRLLHGRQQHGAQQQGALQQRRSVSRFQPPQTAEHRLVLVRFLISAERATHLHPSFSILL